MKTFGKIVICIIVVLIAIGVSYLIYNKQDNNINNSNTDASKSNIVQTNTNNESYNNINNKDTENTDYIGKEENTKFPGENEDEKVNDGIESSEKEEETKLTGKDKAIYIVKTQFAMEGQTVRFDHMEGKNYIVKINDGTAITWYLVDGTTWKAEEY